MITNIKIDWNIPTKMGVGFILKDKGIEGLSHETFLAQGMWDAEEKSYNVEGYNPLLSEEVLVEVKWFVSRMGIPPMWDQPA